MQIRLKFSVDNSISIHLRRKLPPCTQPKSTFDLNKVHINFIPQTLSKSEKYILSSYWLINILPGFWTKISNECFLVAPEPLPPSSTYASN